MKKVSLPKLTAEHILYGIAIANALRLGWAYAEADAGGNILSIPGAVGLLIGAMGSIGTAFIAGKLGGKLTKSRKAISWSAFVIILVVEVLILAPITMTHKSTAMADLLGPGLSWVWSVSLALVPSLVIAGVAVANGGLVEAVAQPQTSGTTEPPAVAEPASAKGSGRSAKVKAEKLEFPCPHAGAGCKVVKPTQEAINAHAGRCKYKPIAVMPEDAPKEKVNA